MNGAIDLLRNVLKTWRRVPEQVTIQQQDVTVIAYAAGRDTSGNYTLVEVVLGRYAVGPPLHHHAGTTEALYVLEGSLVCTLDRRTVMMTPGHALLIHPDMIHTCFNPTAALARVLVLRRPCPIDQQRTALAVLTALAWQTIVRDPVLQAQLTQQYDQHLSPQDQGVA
ncbi:MAG: cupin domain-containing protein [Chloroflexaceae bacterium]|nr:cupin domain-containing protein [Chloroflexaceae bacterium]